MISKCFHSNFFKNTLSSFLAIILFFISLIFLIKYFLIPKEQLVVVKDNSVLKIEFKAPILDRTSGNMYNEHTYEDDTTMYMSYCKKSTKKF